MLERLKQLNVDGEDLLNLVETYANVSRVTLPELAARGLFVPDWVTAKMADLDREIKARQADAKAKLLRDLKAQRATLLTAAEKREALDAQIAALEAQQA